MRAVKATVAEGEVLPRMQPDLYDFPSLASLVLPGFCWAIIYDTQLTYGSHQLLRAPGPYARLAGLASA